MRMTRKCWEILFGFVGEIFGFVSDVSGFFCYFSVKVFGFPSDFLGFCAKDAKGSQLEVGAQLAPRLLVMQNC